MTELQKQEVDTAKLERLYDDDPIARAAFDYFSGRQKNSGVTKVDRLEQLLSQSGGGISRSAVIDFLKRLDEANCGRFVTGRRGHPSRFVWEVQLISVAKAARGEESQVSRLDPSDAALEEDEAEMQAGTLKHTYRLRPDSEITLVLPSDLTPIEANRLADFVRTLPFEAGDNSAV